MLYTFFVVDVKTASPIPRKCIFTNGQVRHALIMKNMNKTIQGKTRQHNIQVNGVNIVCAEHSSFEQHEVLQKTKQY